MNAVNWNRFRQEASCFPARILLADSQDPRAQEAARIARQQKIAEPVLMASLVAAEESHWIQLLSTIPKYKNLTPSDARAHVQDPLIRGCLMLRNNEVDGFIGGATRTTSDTLRAIFSIVGLAPKATTLFGFFFLEAQDGRLILLADCAVIPDPSPKQLAQIAIGAAQAYESFNGTPAKIAFLSFSTNGSADHPFVAKVRQARDMARAKAPERMIEGEWQADTALDAFSAKIKGVADSPMAGQANVLIVPDLNTGNIAYKLAQRLGNCRAVGPVLWGTAAPANDLSRGCSVDDIVDMIALTAIQVRKFKEAEKVTHAH